MQFCCKEKIMNTPETSLIGKIIKAEATEAVVKELRIQGFTENQIPEVGAKRWRIRSRHIATCSDQQIKVKRYLNGEVLGLLNECFDKFYET